jgi:hypothetical protein
MITARRRTEQDELDLRLLIIRICGQVWCCPARVPPICRARRSTPRAGKCASL